MSLRYLLWKTRTQVRFGAAAACFRADTPAEADPGELVLGLAPEARARVAAALGSRDVLRGDWDLGAGDLPGQGDGPVTLVIGRHGDPIVLEGGASVLRAREEGLERIPVRIALVHPAWQRFRNQVLNYCDAHKGRVYQRIDHPDLGRVPFIHGARRMEVIRPHVLPPPGTVLDIGANWGYWSGAFEKLGFDCTAVDHSPKNGFFLRRIRRAAHRTFRFEQTSVFDLPGPLRYDVVLALNIFHHFLRTQATFGRLRDLLGRLEARAMFFESHLEAELEGKGYERNMGPREFVDFLLASSAFTDAQDLGVAENGRPLYLLT